MSGQAGLGQTPDAPTRARVGTVDPRVTDPPAVMSAVALAVAGGTAITRPRLAALTGLARSTVETNVQLLLRRGVLIDGGTARSSRYGRPATSLRLAPDLGLVLVADLTPHHLRLAVADFEQNLLAERVVDHLISDGPEAAVSVIVENLESLVGPFGGYRHRVLVMPIPGPVDVHRGVPVRPPIMPGWDEYPLAHELRKRLKCPVLIDNDVNLMALGESRVLADADRPLLLVKVGTGIGGGIVSASGEVIHGADGAAGDIGHVRAWPGEDVVCTCGNVGCIEAVASLEAISRKLAAADGGDASQDRMLQLVRVGDGIATRMVRDAAEALGEVVASLVHFYNPARVVVAGRLTAASDDLLAGVRSAVYRRALPLATRNLAITHSVLGARAGLVGALVMGIETMLGREWIGTLTRP